MEFCKEFFIIPESKHPEHKIIQTFSSLSNLVEGGFHQIMSLRSTPVHPIRCRGCAGVKQG